MIVCSIALAALLYALGIARIRAAKRQFPAGAAVAFAMGLVSLPPRCSGRSTIWRMRVFPGTWCSICS